MDDPRRPPAVMRGVSPCANCTEKFRACHDRCPKDERADPKDPGYKMWLEQVNKVKATRKAIVESRRQDYIEERRRSKWRKMT